jgi:ATP-dependent DNA helicase RecQ
MHGLDGTEKRLSCSASMLAKVAEQKPNDLRTLERLLGETRTQRFGDAFLDVLAQAS